MKLFSRLADNTQISQNSVDRCRNIKKVNINNKNYTRQIQLAVKVRLQGWRRLGLAHVMF